MGGSQGYLNVIGLPRDASASLLGSRQLGQGIEVCVAGTEDQRMLEDQSCDPHIVGGYRCALFPELTVNVGVVVCCLVVGIEDADARFHEEAAEDGFVAGAVRS